LPSGRATLLGEHKVAQTCLIGASTIHTDCRDRSSSHRLAAPCTDRPRPIGLVSNGRNCVDNMWLFTSGEDLFVALDDVVDVAIGTDTAGVWATDVNRPRTASHGHDRANEMTANRKTVG
jgi:hypothetical protein